MAYTTLVSADTLFTHHRRPDWVVVDCRFVLQDTEAGRQSYLEGHVPGAVYAHLDEDLSGPVRPGVTGRHPFPAPDLLAVTFSRLGIDDGMQVIAYDDSGGAIASRLWVLLNWLGHRSVAVLDGGWRQWVARGYPTRAGLEHSPPRSFVPRPDDALLVDAGTVDRIRRDPAYRLLDARARQRYLGESEPIDPVAGHIPGARSAPFAENLAADGCFLPSEALRDRFAPLLDGTPPERVVCYCGSGVTANHNLLALAHAGIGRGRLYAGSWSEWITDPTRPVATGP